MEEKPNYYSIIPANVRYDDEISDKAKLLYGEITSLTNKTGECWASNKYFSDLYNVSNETISRLISSLIAHDYLERRMIYKNDTKEIVNRVLIPIDKNVNTYCQKYQYPIDKNVKDNNTSINNINNNNIYEYYENIFTRTLNSIEYQTMSKWLEDKTEEEIKKAIDETAKSNIDNIKYVQKVLYSKRKNKKGIEPEWLEEEHNSTEDKELGEDFNSFIEDFRNVNK